MINYPRLRTLETVKLETFESVGINHGALRQVVKCFLSSSQHLGLICPKVPLVSSVSLRPCALRQCFSTFWAVSPGKFSSYCPGPKKCFSIISAKYIYLLKNTNKCWFCFHYSSKCCFTYKNRQLKS